MNVFSPVSGPRRHTWHKRTRTSHLVGPMRSHQHQFPGPRCMLSITAGRLHVYLCLFINSSQRTCYGNLYTGTMQCCCFCVTLSRSNLHEPCKFPYIVLFNTTHVISNITWECLGCVLFFFQKSCFLSGFMQLSVSFRDVINVSWPFYAVCNGVTQ